MTAGETRLLTESAARFGVELGSEAIARLERFLDLLSLWNRRVHLTGERDPEALLRKHVVDTLAPAAARMAEEVELRPKGSWDYHLPGGERRRLLFFAAMC